MSARAPATLLVLESLGSFCVEGICKEFKIYCCLEGLRSSIGSGDLGPFESSNAFGGDVCLLLAQLQGLDRAGAHALGAHALDAIRPDQGLHHDGDEELRALDLGASDEQLAPPLHPERLRVLGPVLRGLGAPRALRALETKYTGQRYVVL